MSYPPPKMDNGNGLSVGCTISIKLPISLLGVIMCISPGLTLHMAHETIPAPDVWAHPFLIGVVFLSPVLTMFPAAIIVPPGIVAISPVVGRVAAFI